MSQMKVDINLVDKYNVPGPRYTSYPTAPNFKKKFTSSEWEKIIEKSDKSSTRGVSMYIHIPFCDSLCLYCGCNVVITKKNSVVKEYLKHLQIEIETLSRLISNSRKVVQLHFGGGTPNHLTPDEIIMLGKILKDRFNISNDAEISVEVNPANLTYEHVQAFKEAGFNRASMGIQDFNSKVQTTIKRIQSEEVTKQAVDWFRKEGFNSINVDLIYGLPYQSVDSFHTTLEDVIRLNPDRMAVFNFAYVPWLKPHQNAIKTDTLPSGAEKLKMLKDIIETLTNRQYIYIGMDHFAKSDDELCIAQNNHTLHRNFQGYSTKADCDLFALGITGISMLFDAYVQNVKTLPEYYSLLKEKQLPAQKGIILNKDDIIRRDVIMRLMCYMEVAIREVEEKYKIDFYRYFPHIEEKLKTFIDDNLLSMSSEKIKVNNEGRLFIRNIAMQFDAYLNLSEKKFSKTV